MTDGTKELVRLKRLERVVGFALAAAGAVFSVVLLRCGDLTRRRVALLCSVGVGEFVLAQALSLALFQPLIALASLDNGTE